METPAPEPVVEEAPAEKEPSQVLEAKESQKQETPAVTQT